MRSVTRLLVALVLAAVTTTAQAHEVRPGYLAQRLYEGIDIGGETAGLISYMRTDSVTLSNEAVSGCRAAIEADYGTARSSSPCLISTPSPSSISSKLRTSSA